ncbi:MAG: bifunctional 4-hydroxy-2-oxoglutarate aldolase/2-dehydro-3-deoxy-phosphogluconate aldolase [Pirellulales bacterium]
MHEVLEQVGVLRLVPMVVMDDAAHADGFGDALAAGGLLVAEITFRTEAAEESIRRLARRGDLLVGAGTVLTPQQADRAIDAGAAFLVAPGTNPRVIDHCLLRSVPIVPGVATPTDIELAMSFGLDTVKFFPAENLGGTATLKALSGPYADMMFLPTGGITPELLPSYLNLPYVLACGGSWLAPREALAKGDFTTIKARIAEAARLLASVPR